MRWSCKHGRIARNWVMSGPANTNLLDRMAISTLNCNAENTLPIKPSKNPQLATSTRHLRRPIKDMTMPIISTGNPSITATTPMPIKSPGARFPESSASTLASKTMPKPPKTNTGPIIIAPAPSAITAIPTQNNVRRPVPGETRCVLVSALWPCRCSIDGISYPGCSRLSTCTLVWPGGMRPAGLTFPCSWLFGRR